MITIERESMSKYTRRVYEESVALAADAINSETGGGGRITVQ